MGLRLFYACLGGRRGAIRSLRYAFFPGNLTRSKCPFALGNRCSIPQSYGGNLFSLSDGLILPRPPPIKSMTPNRTGCSGVAEGVLSTRQHSGTAKGCIRALPGVFLPHRQAGTSPTSLSRSDCPPSRQKGNRLPPLAKFPGLWSSAAVFHSWLPRPLRTTRAQRQSVLVWPVAMQRPVRRRRLFLLK